MDWILLVSAVVFCQTATADGTWLDLLETDASGKPVYWQPMLDAPRTARLTVSQAAAERNALLKGVAASWVLKHGELAGVGDAPGVETKREFMNALIKLEWLVKTGGEAVVHLRGVPAFRLRDTKVRFDKDLGLGSGGLFLNQQFKANPAFFADNAVGTWNEMEIRHLEDRVTVILNGTRVVDGEPLEPYWKPTQPNPREGPIGLGSVRGGIRIRAFVVKQL